MEHVAADARRLKLKGLKAQQTIAQGKRSEASAALGYCPEWLKSALATDCEQIEHDPLTHAFTVRICGIAAQHRPALRPRCFGVL